MELPLSSVCIHSDNAGELKLFKEKVKDVSHTQENAACRDGDISDVCAPRDQSDSQTERNGMKTDSNNSSGDAEKTRHSSDLDGELVRIYS